MGWVNDIKKKDLHWEESTYISIDVFDQFIDSVESEFCEINKQK